MSKEDSINDCILLNNSNNNNSNLMTSDNYLMEMNGTTTNNPNIIMMNNFDGHNINKTNEYLLNLNIGNQVYYLNNTNCESVRIDNNNMDEYHFNNTNENNTHHNLMWISPNNLPTTSNNYFEFPYVQITNTTDTNIQVKEGLQFLNILHQDQLINNETSQFINNNSQNDCVVEKRSSSSTSKNNHDENDDDDDDDVIFVKEYYLNTKNNRQIKERRNKRKFVQTEPRRNPKRQVQLQKASIELALKLSNKEQQTNNIRTRRAASKLQEFKNIRKSCRTSTTPLSLSSPSSSSYKEFNESSAENELELKKHLNGTNKNKSSFKKPDTRKRLSSNKKIKKSHNAIIDKDFMKLISGTYFTLIDYVKEIKDDLKTSNVNNEYFNQLKEVLKYSCQLYSVVSGIKTGAIKDILK